MTPLERTASWPDAVEPPYSAAVSGQRGCQSFSGLEAPAAVAGFDDVTVMDQAVEQRSGHLRVAKDRRPFVEVEGFHGLAFLRAGMTAWPLRSATASWHSSHGHRNIRHLRGRVHVKWEGDSPVLPDLYVGRMRFPPTSFQEIPDKKLYF